MAYDVRKAFLADQVYHTDNMQKGTMLTDPTGGRWELALKWDSKTNGVNDGYQGSLFKSLDTGKYEFASRGTEPKKEPYKDLVVADLQMGFKVISDQMVSQRKFFQEAQIEIIKNNGNPATDLSAVGDSLGASLVTLLGVENPGLKVDGFNPYGVGNLVAKGSYSNITNHVLARDPVSVLPGSYMIGKTYMYNEPDNPAGNTSLDWASHTTRSLWQTREVTAQTGKAVNINVYTPLNWQPSADGGGIQGDPFTGMPWPTANDVTASGNGYNFPNTAGAGRGVIHPELVTAPTDLGTPSRNSANFITDTNANDHLAVIKAGGTLSDLWVLQKNAANGFANAKEFYAAVLASNPGITDVNKIAPGTTIYLPQKLSDGSTTYHYAGGTAINTNAATGEYHMVVPDGSGGTVVFSRKADEFGYTVRQVNTDRWGNETSNYTGYQETLAGEIKPMGLNWQTPTERGSSTWAQGEDGNTRTDAVTDKVTGTTTLTAIDEETGQSKTLAVRPSGMSEDAYNNQMYSSMAGFLNALRGKDKLGMALNGAKMIVDTAIYNNKGEVPSDVLGGANKTVAGLSATVGIVAGLHALKSKDTQNVRIARNCARQRAKRCSRHIHKTDRVLTRS